MSEKEAVRKIARVGYVLSGIVYSIISCNIIECIKRHKTFLFSCLIFNTLACFCIVLSVENSYAQASLDSIRVYFRQGRAEIDTTNNLKELEKAVLQLFSENSESVCFIRSVAVVGGASPEGGIAVNRRLSEQRAKNLFNYLSGKRMFPDSICRISFLGRDWAGLLRLIENSVKVPYKAEVVSLLRGVIDGIAKKGQDSEENLVRLQRLRGGVPYTWLYRNLFPELRGSSLYISYGMQICPGEPETPVCLPDAIADSGFIKKSETLRHPGQKDNSSEYNAVSQRCWWALKTNLLYDVLLVPDISAEFYLGRNWSITGNWMYAWWRSNRRHNYWRIYGGGLELRRWFGRRAEEKPLTGHHFGLYGQIFTYDFEMGGRGYMGGKPGGTLWEKLNYATGAEYGYSLPFGRRINLDFTIGIGYWGGTYHEYLPQDGHYVWQATKQRRWFGPTKAEICLVWLLGRENINRKRGG